eukprot:230873_1
MSSFSNIVTLNHDILLIANIYIDEKSQQAPWSLWKYIISKNTWDYKHYKLSLIDLNINYINYRMDVHFNKKTNTLYLCLNCRNNETNMTSHHINITQYNLNTSKWKLILPTSNINFTAHKTISIMIENNIHIFNTNKHYIYNTKTETVENVYTDNNYFVQKWQQNAEIIYLKNKKILLLKNSSINGSLYSYSIKDKIWRTL